ncbi:MAG TPA: outer membrane protein assembly factor BamD [Vitreimonas sp.]|nr:outer membrane protein assembly factor BamD [Vitreimonas sp.]
MTDRSAPLLKTARHAALIAAAGFFLAIPAAAQTTLPPPAFGTADQRQDRIQELESSLRDAEGRNEDLQRQLNEANREITRLRGMVGELAGVNQSLATPPAEGDAATPAPQSSARPGGSAEVAPPTLNDAQRRATGTLGSMPATAAPAPAAVVVEPGDAYSRARELLVDGQYAEAEAAFGNFLEQHPDAEQAADARFWFAFTLLARNNYRDAAQNFTSYLRANPQAPRAAEAQVRLGMALIGMSQDGANDAAERRQACAAFTRLPQNAPRSVRDLAARESRAAQCAA